jgi:hypothetical protein
VERGGGERFFTPSLGGGRGEGGRISEIVKDFPQKVCLFKILPTFTTDLIIMYTKILKNYFFLL